MNHRDMMAPDTDPTDEELEVVAKEALRIAQEQEGELRQKTVEALKEAAAAAEMNRFPRRSPGGVLK